MSVKALDTLGALIAQERAALLAQWRELVWRLPSAQQLDIPTLNDHIPGLLDELVKALEEKSDQTISEALKAGCSTAHGLQRLHDDFDIEEVVAEYNILRGCIHDLAEVNDLNLQGKPFRILNRVFDLAIGVALKTYATQRALEVRRRREDYLAFVAHDLRTPLNAISMAGRVLERTVSQGGASADSDRMLKSLRRNVQHLEKLVEKILEENTNLETEIGIKLERREFDLWPLVEALVHDLHPVAGTSSTPLKNQVPEELVVYADAGLLRRVFQNLIANAIKYTPSGEISIGARERDVDHFVECWVTDNGAGIPEAILKNVFDNRETDPQNSGGWGLGLAIVKTFIEAHRGTVSVESKEGIGSTFRFSIPGKATATAITHEQS